MISAFDGKVARFDREHFSLSPRRPRVPARFSWRQKGPPGRRLIGIVGGVRSRLPRWESRPEAHPTAIYASRYAYLSQRAFSLPYVSKVSRGINEDERHDEYQDGRDGGSEVKEGEESRTRPGGTDGKSG